MRSEPIYIPDPLMETATALYIEHGAKSAAGYLNEHGIPISELQFRWRMKDKGVRTEKDLLSNFGVPWSLEEIATLNTYYPGSTPRYRVEAALPGRSWTAIRAKALGLGLRRETPGVAPSSMPQLRLDNLEFTKPVLVLADLHVPFQHEAWINRVLRLAEAWEVDDLILAGDNVDAQQLSKFQKFDDPSSMREIEDWGRVEESLLRHFHRIHAFLGNHDARWGKKMDWAIPLGQAIKRLFVNDKDRVTIYDAYAVEVNNQWHLEHPKGSGMQVALDLVSHHLMNVAVAHTHHASTARDPSGRFFGIRIGAAADHSRMPYCSMVTHGKYDMTNGALMLVPGDDGITRAWNLEPEMDLRAMERMYRPAVEGMAQQDAA